MQHSKLQDPILKYYLRNYKEWLDILGYSAAMCKNYPHQVCEFLYWLEQQRITNMQTLQHQDLQDYYQQLKQRANKTQGGGLSTAYLNSHQQSLKKFQEYLRKHHQIDIRVSLEREKSSTTKQRNILSVTEIKSLFKATDYSHVLYRFRARHKALLACLYSCGMRRNETLNLQLCDVLFDKRRIYVRKGKNYKERFVPITAYHLQILEDYMYQARLEFKKSSQSKYVFVTEKSIKMGGFALENDLKQMLLATIHTTMIHKHITPHALRHSIATHLLQAGMGIEDIQQFLGHSSLESTQMYTHILNDDG